MPSEIRTNPPNYRDWRCWKCFKLLGKRIDDRVHFNFARGHQYVATCPVSAVCRCCGKLNELT